MQGLNVLHDSVIGGMMGFLILKVRSALISSNSECSVTCFPYQLVQVKCNQ